MKNKLNDFLKLEKTFVLKVLNNVLYVKDFWKELGLGTYLKHGKGYEEFEQHFNINLVSMTKQNLKKQKDKNKYESFQLDRICKNPKCKKHFTWNSNPYSEFCSRSCANAYSSSFSSSKSISHGMKLANATKTKFIACAGGCGKMIKVSISTTKKYCDDCFKNMGFTGICLICGKQISLTRTRKKTCCKEHENLLRARSNSNYQKIAHTSGGYRKGAGHGKKGWYKGYWCDSSWELAWVIYSLDHNIKFERCKEKFKYIFKNKIHHYYPDFKLEDGTYIEIKGYQYPNWKSKCNQISIPLKILYERDIQPIIQYVKEKYGLNWIELYDNSKPQKDFSKQKYVWIHKNGKNTWIYPNKLKEYQQNGWILGRI